MLKSEIKDILEKPTWLLLFVTSVFYFLGLFLFRQFVWDESFLLLNYKAETGFENYIDMVRRIDFVRYLFTPIYMFLVAVIISALIKIGLSGNDIDFNNKLLFKIVLLSSCILSLPFWIKTVWFILIKGSYTANEVNFFYPLSVLNFFDQSKLHELMIHALGKLDLYHLAFIAFVAWSIKLYSKLSFTRLFGIVVYTYGLGFVLIQILPILIFI